jgi:Tol biopolymer transport system component/DNA-binding winged helix-turn-helix (wHTH) protein
VVYEFEDFRLDSEQKVLLHNRQPVSLPQKAFETLLFMVQNGGRILEKDELMKAVWPDSFVEENNLSQNIFALRRVLGDDRNGHSFIQTIPRRGFRFIPSVKQSGLVLDPAGFQDPGKPSVSPEYWTKHSPFRSLQAFEAEDAWLFFGRGSETEDLVSRLRRSRVLAVAGNSGSGKSSLVRAGLIPALRDGRFHTQGSSGPIWRTAVFRPSGAPFDYLAEILPNHLAPGLGPKERADFITECRAKLPSGGEFLSTAINALVSTSGDQPAKPHVLLVADQFEEIFTLVSNCQIRVSYIDALLNSIREDAAIPVYLVVVLRADFYANCLEHPTLSRCLEANLFNVPRMSTEKLRESIESRLLLAGASAENGLVESLLEDVGTDPGNLALMEHALGQLWERCAGNGRILTNQAYTQIGRLRGALGRHADDVYESLGNEKIRQSAQRILLELVHLGEGAQDTRRRVRKSDLYSLCTAEELDPVLSRLISSRLVSSGMDGQETFIEVSHEALIREWPALREWLAQNRDQLLLERRLDQAAGEWEQLGRDRGALLQGARLVRAQEWLAKQKESRSSLRGFVQASTEAQAESEARERNQEKELRKRSLTLILVIAVTIFAAAVYGTFTLLHRPRPVPFASMEITQLTNSGKALMAAISPDGKSVIYVEEDVGLQSLWIRHIPTQSSTRIVPPSDIKYYGLNFSPDGNYIYFTQVDKDQPGLHLLYQVPVLGGTPRLIISDIDSPCISFSPDGRRFAFRRELSHTSAVLVADADGSHEQKIAELNFPAVFMGSPSWSPDGRVIATAEIFGQGRAEGQFVALDVATGQASSIASSSQVGNIMAASWLPDGSALLVEAFSPNVASWNAQIGSLSYPAGEFHRITNDLNEYTGPISTTLDERFLVALVREAFQNIWVMPASGKATQAIQISAGKAEAANLDWTPDGRILSSSITFKGFEFALRNRDGSGKSTLFSSTSPLLDPSACGDGRHIVYRSENSEGETIWRTDSNGANPKQITSGSLRAPICSPDGQWLAYYAHDQTGNTIWKISIEGGTAQRVSPPFGAGYLYGTNPAISPDGNMIAFVTAEGTPPNERSQVVVVPSKGGPPLHTLRIDPRVFATHLLRFMPDGKSVAYIVNDRGVSNLWAIRLAGGAPKQITDFKSDLIFDFAWSRDGKQLALSRGRTTQDVVLLRDTGK